MMREKTNSNQILYRLNSAALEKGIDLTEFQKILYLRILDYALANGEVSAEGLILELKTDDYVRLFNVAKGGLPAFFKKLSECGIILRFNNGTRKAATIVLKKEFYQKEG